MKLFAQVAFIVRAEVQFFARFPKLLLATALVALIPALYALIYLSSVWDPEAHSGALPVGLVNQDEGVEYREHVFNMGWDVANGLRKKQTFGFKDILDAEDARRQVRAGQLAFALIIPKDFSSNAIPGKDAGAGKIVVFTSEGNNFESARIAKLFAQELGHDVNETLNERRWKLVLSSAAGSQRSVDRLHEGVAQLRSGVKELAVGANQTASGANTLAKGSDLISDGVTQLTSGVKQLAVGLKTMEANRARNSELNRLKAGAEELAAAQIDMGKGLDDLKDGSKRLVDGVATFRAEAKSSLLVPASVVDGLDQVHNGASQLDGGLQTATTAQQKLIDGSASLSTGVNAVTTGMRTLQTGVRAMVGKLPADSQLDELDSGARSLNAGTVALAEGTQKVKAGADRVNAGMDLLQSALPAAVDQPDGSAQGLATSVQPQLEIEATVANSGSAFAPNVIPAALWLGAGIAAFLVHLRVLPRHAQFFSRLAQALGKITVPASIVLLQAACVWFAVVVVLKISVAHPVAFVLVLGVASVTFLTIVFALTRAFGDAGKAFAMIFLAVQITSSGGVLPVELSGGFFTSISPWLPLTWVVRALKASLFDAYGGAWQYPLTIVALAGCATLVSTIWIGRWRFIKSSSMRPAVDF
jgi:putative membrane protein